MNRIYKSNLLTALSSPPPRGGQIRLSHFTSAHLLSSLSLLSLGTTDNTFNAWCLGEIWKSLDDSRQNKTLNISYKLQVCFITEDQRQAMATVVKFQVLLKVHQKLHFLWRKHPADLRSLNMDVALQIMAASANLPSFQLGGSSVPSFLFSQWYPRGVKLWTPHATYWEVGFGVFKSWAAESVLIAQPG